MSLKALTKNQKGFTIIEVMIVLAIAGLIILVVFLAVPALQRNSRNTQRKNDVQAVLGAIQEWINNNNGGIPDAQSQATGGDISEAIANVSLGYYDVATDIYWDGALVNGATGGRILTGTNAATDHPTDGATQGLVFNPTNAATPDAAARDHIIMWSGADCDGPDDSPDGTGPARSIAIAYVLETGGGDVDSCIHF